MNRDEIMEALLLRAAVEACRERDQIFATHPYMYPDTPGATACAWGTAASDEGGEHKPASTRATTLTEALTALLTDLGAPVPEWPSAEHLKAIPLRVGMSAGELELEYLRDLFVREPMTVLALLAGEG